MRRLVLVLLLGLWPGIAAAQAWSGILATTRAVDWSTAGVTGGIPTGRTQCGSTVAAGTSAASIQSLINACSANTYLLLGAGTFNLTEGIWISASSVTLRGSGAQSTILNFTGDTSCWGQYTFLCISNAAGITYYADSSGTEPGHTANWTAGYSKGTTTITISNSSGLAVGQYLVIDQQNDTSDPGATIYTCGTSGVCVQQGSTYNGRAGRGSRQFVKVVSCSPSCNSGSSTDVTITPGVYAPNIVSGKNPSSWWGTASQWITGVGIENLTIYNNRSSGSTPHMITMLFGSDHWVQGVRSINSDSPQDHIQLYEVAHITIMSNYLVGSRGDADSSQNYGINCFGCSDSLVINNIMQHRTTGYISNGDQGSVWAYNFAYDNHYTANGSSPHWMQAEHYSHEIGNLYVLREGNVGISMKWDVIHGTANLFTAFRNWMNGLDDAAGRSGEEKTVAAGGSQSSPILLHTNMRFMNFVGNVLGTSGYHAHYENGATRYLSIYSLDESYGGIASDGVVIPSMMRWGNWDVVTSTNDNGTNDSTGTKWASSEVPEAAGAGSSLLCCTNEVPASQTLPASFFLSSRPSWFGYNGTAVAWPPIGPDVANGNISNTGGHANKIPAQLCYENAATDSNYSGYYVAVKQFNPATCYANVSTGGDPSAPVLIIR